LTLDHSGAAWFPAERTLVVSDLHLEKGSNVAARGRLIPALDSHDTLTRLRCVIEAYRPARVVCLGDSFHDGRAGARMAEADRQALASLCALAEDWVWIGGNHDPELPEFCEGERRRDLRIEGVILRHKPGAVREAPEIVGHFHPKASVPTVGRRVSGRCFCVSDDLLIMPAFGAYTGGLNCAAEALRSLHGSEPKIFMLHASKVWRVA
jgi:DNA ligase-associated metallophosphoesterase